MKDEFGAEPGSLAALINTKLTKKVKSASDIQKEVGCATGLTRYLEKMVIKGHLKKTKKGYRLI